MNPLVSACTCRRRFLRLGSLAGAGLSLGAVGVLGALAGCSPRESGASSPPPTPPAWGSSTRGPGSPSGRGSR